VINGYVGRSGKANPHKIYGYLRTPEMSEHIAEFIQPDHLAYGSSHGGAAIPG